jgi:hypothetical protein
MLAARAAWRRGHFTTCLEEIDRVEALLTPRTELGADALLLRSRARLRNSRPQDVIDELSPLLGEFKGLDESCAAQMLHATAVARVVDPGRGSTFVADLHAAFDVGSTGRLIAACHQRGIGSPTWSDRETSPRQQRIVG